MGFTCTASFMSTVVNNTACSGNPLGRKNELEKTPSDTGASQTETICQVLPMDGGENSEIWDQSHRFGFTEQHHHKLEPL